MLERLYEDKKFDFYEKKTHPMKNADNNFLGLLAFNIRELKHKDFSRRRRGEIWEGLNSHVVVLAPNFIG